MGAGFGGLQAAQSLAHSGAKVILLDRNNYHTFVPLLYQVATAQLEPNLIALPIRTLLRRSPNVLFQQAEVKRIDFQSRCVETDSSAISYDYLVLATGSQSQFLGVPGAEQFAFPLRTLPQAIALQYHLLSCFERAANELDEARRQALLTFAIVGGGATGVEMAGALVELVRGALKRDYAALLKVQQVKILLLQSGDRLLPDLPAQLGHAACRRLRQLGIDVYLHTKVTRVLPDSLQLETGLILPTETVIWTAGLSASYPPTSETLETVAKHKLKVRRTLQLPNYPEVYAIGDAAYVEHNGKPLAGVAPEALQEGVAVARNICSQMQGKSPKPFRYFNKGRLAIIGCYSGVGKIAKMPLIGFLAWFMWLAVHLVYLPGFRNRLFVLLSWLHSYGWGDRAVRQILPIPTAHAPVALDQTNLKEHQLSQP